VLPRQAVPSGALNGVIPFPRDSTVGVIHALPVGLSDT